ncbi:unnamed protein product [Prorocentrum cordatum]|uniref:Uncharacterized protein n=1 Tax=Prorocentrum cordatum TaxID=2364126 RepID=A0ABN9R3A4_9DINO|nr:unnamed protein product [Polarella glacialis]
MFKVIVKCLMFVPIVVFVLVLPLVPGTTLALIVQTTPFAELPRTVRLLVRKLFVQLPEVVVFFLMPPLVIRIVLELPLRILKFMWMLVLKFVTARPTFLEGVPGALHVQGGVENHGVSGASYPRLADGDPSCSLLAHGEIEAQSVPSVLVRHPEDGVSGVCGASQHHLDDERGEGPGVCFPDRATPYAVQADLPGDVRGGRAGLPDAREDLLQGCTVLPHVVPEVSESSGHAGPLDALPDCIQALFSYVVQQPGSEAMEGDIITWYAERIEDSIQTVAQLLEVQFAIQDAIHQMIVGGWFVVARQSGDALRPERRVLMAAALAR